MIFTARRYASAVLAVVVCLSACLSVTSWYCIKMATLRIMQTTPHDSPGTLCYTHAQTRRVQQFYRASFALAVYAMVVCLSVCPSVCPSQVGVLLKWLNVGTRKQRHTIAQRL